MTRIWRFCTNSSAGRFSLLKETTAFRRSRLALSVRPTILGGGFWEAGGPGMGLLRAARLTFVWPERVPPLGVWRLANSSGPRLLGRDLERRWIGKISRPVRGMEKRFSKLKYILCFDSKACSEILFSEHWFFRIHNGTSWKRHCNFGDMRFGLRAGWGGMTKLRAVVKVEYALRKDLIEVCQDE